MVNKIIVILYYLFLKSSLVSIILGVCLALAHQTQVLAKATQSKTLTTNTKSPILAQLLPPSTIAPSTKKPEPIFNPIEPNPFPNLPYVVYIDSENPLLLGIIRQQIEPRAVLRYFGDRTVIQVGSFSQLFFALDLLDYLEGKGINGRLKKLGSDTAFGQPVESTPTLAASVYPPVFSPITYGLSNTESYYVLIPSKSKDLSLITYKLRLLGIPERGIQVTETPENVAIGPFPEQETAKKWQRYLLDSGFANVVIYFGL